MHCPSLRRAAALLSLAAGSLCLAPAAHAVLVNGTFSGTMNTGPSSLSGMAFTGTFQYDTSIAADSGGDSGQSTFRALTDFSFNVGSGTYASTGFTPSATPSSNIQMYNNLGAPDFDHISFVPFAPELSAPDIAGDFFDFAVLRLDDPTESVFSTAAALPTSLNFSAFSGGVFDLFVSINGGDGESITHEIDGTLSSLSITVSNPTVPEPATLSLVGIGIAGLGGALRRRRIFA